MIDNVRGRVRKQKMEKGGQTRTVKLGFYSSEGKDDSLVLVASWSVPVGGVV